jgi:glutamine amidotransferase
MCRWVAYYGNPIHPETLLYDTQHSLVEQSRSDRLAGGQPNADGVGLGWYGEREFRHGRWLFMDNGFIEGYLDLRRELLLAVEPSIFSGIAGTTDSELMFYLALTFGLEEEPLAALERMAGFVEETGRRRGVEEPLQMTVAASDGERLYAARYASGPVVNSLFVTADASAVRALYPGDARLEQFSDESRAVVSEPLGDLPGLWNEVPAGTAIVVQPGHDARVPFTPRSP